MSDSLESYERLIKKYKNVQPDELNHAKNFAETFLITLKSSDELVKQHGQDYVDGEIAVMELYIEDLNNIIKEKRNE